MVSIFLLPGMAKILLSSNGLLTDPKKNLDAMPRIIIFTAIPMILSVPSTLKLCAL